MIRVVMLAGPFIDDPDGNKVKFEKANLELWQAGFFGFNPIANGMPMFGVIPEAVFRERDLWIVERMDALLMMTGWEESNGAQREHKEALRLGKPVFYSLDALLNCARALEKE